MINIKPSNTRKNWDINLYLNKKWYFDIVDFVVGIDVEVDEIIAVSVWGFRE